MEERNLLSVVYKQRIALRRASHRVVRMQEDKEEKKPSQGRDQELHISMLREYKEKIAQEVYGIIKEVTGRKPRLIP